MQDTDNVVALRNWLAAGLDEPPIIISGLERAPVYWIVESRTGRAGVRKQFPTQQQAFAYATEAAARHREVFDVFVWSGSVGLRPQAVITLAEPAP